MSDSVELFPAPATDPAPARSDVAVLPCGRCQVSYPVWEMRSFGGKPLCVQCYGATVELARAAIGAMRSDEPDRLCRNCRALADPSVGSAWCSVTELGDERARICENFVAARQASARTVVAGGRAQALDIWSRLSDTLNQTLGESNFATWFGGVEPVDLADGTLVLAVPDPFTRDWLEQRLQPVLQNALALCGFPGVGLAYVIEQTDELVADDDPTPELEREAAKAKAGFNPHYTFREFIVGSGNRLAHASALAAVDKPGQAYNPLVLYGGVGVGKTHLLQAIGQEAIDQGRGQILYVTSEAFTNELIQAIRAGATGEFRERFRSVDYLLLDDIQFISGKEATQEEFFHTFNALHQAGKQIVMTSDRPPTELRVLQDRLRSRFEWGLTVDMQPPDLETRIAIVRAKAEARHRLLNETVITTLATRACANVRELEGALNRVLALADLLGTEPGMETLRSVLGDEQSRRSGASAEDVVQAVAAYYRVKPSDLTGQQRERSIVYARQMAMYLMREEAKMALTEIGNYLGGRNHSTVIYGCDKIGGEVRRKGRVKQDIQAIKQLMYGPA